jgi:hypothetical protein
MARKLPWARMRSGRTLAALPVFMGLEFYEFKRRAWGGHWLTFLGAAPIFGEGSA